ncbi:L-serine ammonia-lyase, iron-sulfur-dependent, subunit alpha [Erysipelotrichaceae bacterium HCN-30851]
MERHDVQYDAYIALLNKELVPAMGCTEPIAIAYAAAVATSYMEYPIEKVDIYASGNIIKNVKSVTVPNTGGRKGIQSAAAIGIVAGDASKGLEVIAHVNNEQIKMMEEFIKNTDIQIHHEQSNCALKVGIQVSGQGHSVYVCIQNEHSNIVCIKKDEELIFDHQSDKETQELLDAMEFSMKSIYEFALMAEIEDVKEVLDRQMGYNYNIAEEGLKGNYGANIGSVLLSTYGNDVQTRARAYAAAGSDARMSGCELPVIICSGSGNQGITCSVPVIVYAKELGVNEEQLYRALLISNLTTLYQKKYIGRLSAFCGAVSAGVGAGAGISYLLGGDYDAICHTVVNALAIASGMICDGAKASCAAKIATAVDAGIMGCMMYRNGKQFYKGEGIVCKNIEETIMGVGHLARDGMKKTDDEIIRLMIQN